MPASPCAASQSSISYGSAVPSLDWPGGRRVAVSFVVNFEEGAELSMMLQDRLSEFRETLQGKDVIIFDKRLVADEPLTLQELGDEFGVSRERVRQLEARLTGKLRDYLKETLGDAVELS